jgi:hypothetical protein
MLLVLVIIIGLTSLLAEFLSGFISPALQRLNLELVQSETNLCTEQQSPLKPICSCTVERSQCTINKVFFSVIINMSPVPK